MIRVGDRVTIVDRYRTRPTCPCGLRTLEPSSFDGLRGVVTKADPLMVHLDGERLPMRFDERDIARDESTPTWVAGE